MKILFFALHWGYLRHYRSVLETLAERGHRIHLAVDKHDKIGSVRMIEALVANHPEITYGETPDRGGDTWLDVGTWIRLGLDYLRYLSPEYDRFPKLRSRSRERTPWLIRLWTLLPGFGSHYGRAFLGLCLLAMERDLPIDRKTRAFIREHAPDVVLITPLLGLGTPQFDQVRCAKVMGLRTMLCVGSWDHLSSKALIRFTPDRVAVWNETQKREAVEMHGLAPESIAVTGAQGWDQWFGRAPATTRAEFCARLGLDTSRPFVLYLCSTPFHGSMPESEFVVRWIEALRGSDRHELQEVGVLIRPHPQRSSEWAAIDLGIYHNVTLWGDNPVTQDARNDYFDSMAHCSAAVGLNTSAMIEAGILGKAVHTILAPEYHESQIETIHFHYLLEIGGGLLHTARDFAEHGEQLLVALARDGADPRSLRFTGAFVRPQGIDIPATPIFARAVETLIDEPPRPDRVSNGTRLLQVLLLPMMAPAWLCARLFGFILGSPMNVHRGKKKIRAAFLNVLWMLERGQKNLRKATQVADKKVRYAVFRAGKRIAGLYRAAGELAARANRQRRLRSHRFRKKVSAARRLLARLLGGSPARIDDDR